MKKMTRSYAGGSVQLVLVADDFEFGGLSAPAAPQTLLQLVKTNVNIVTTLGFYFWDGMQWTNVTAGGATSAQLAAINAAIAAGTASYPGGSVIFNTDTQANWVLSGVGTAAAFSAVGGGGNSGGQLAPYQGQIATRCRNPNYQVAGKSFQATAMLTIRSAVNNGTISVKFPNFAVLTAGTTPTGSGVETGPGGSTTFTGSLKKSDGTYYQILFAGSSSGVAPDGGFVIGTASGVTCKDGEVLSFNAWGSTNGTVLCFNKSSPSNDNVYSVVGDALNFSGSVLPDLTMSGAVTNTATLGVMFFPMEVVGLTTKPSFKINADSREHGIWDKVDASGDIGQLERIIGAKYGYINCSTQGDQAFQMTTNFTNRAASAAVCSHSVWGAGVNDLRSGAKTAAQIQGYYATLYAIEAAVNPNIQQWQETIYPYTTSSDQWQTITNQTTAALAETTKLNELIRTAVWANRKGFLELSDAVSYYRNSGLLAVPGLSSTSITASISGTTMTITAFGSPATPVALGQAVIGAAVGTYVNQFISGTGSTGTYGVSISQTVASTTLTLANVDTYDGLHLNFLGIFKAVYKVGARWLQQLGG